MELIGIPSNIAAKLKARVSDFLVDGQWCIPQNFRDAFLDIVLRIEGVAPYKKGDTLVWTPSKNGTLSFANAYKVCYSRGTNCKWMSRIWQGHILPRRLVLVYRECCKIKWLRMIMLDGVV